jgi:uncharacterized protein with HEPN domain
MSNREVEFYIVDICIAYNKIKRYTSSFKNAQEFLHSELEWDATIRELEIIGEATNQLIKSNILDKEFRIIVDFRNQINHGYFGINENIVWEVVSEYLDEFYQNILLITKKENLILDEAIGFAKKDNSFNPKTLFFLDNLLNFINKMED